MTSTEAKVISFSLMAILLAGGIPMAIRHYVYGMPLWQFPPTGSGENAVVDPRLAVTSFGVAASQVRLPDVNMVISGVGSKMPMMPEWPKLPLKLEYGGMTLFEVQNKPNCFLVEGLANESEGKVAERAIRLARREMKVRRLMFRPAPNKDYSDVVYCFE